VGTASGLFVEGVASLIPGTAAAATGTTAAATTPPGQQLLQRAQAAFAPGQWLPHFMKHGSEFGFTSSVQYLRAAQNLVAGGQGVHTFVRANGDTLFYRAATNEFAVLTAQNVIRTFFTPTEGVLYWFQQTGQLILR
jgi:pyocin large subunit-like protein